jgi:hypothetical protein
VNFRRTVEVDSEAEALGLMARAETLFDDLTSFWPRFQREYLQTTLPVRWDRGFGLGLDLHEETITNRYERPEGTYYRDHAPVAKARPSEPAYVWTGALQEAVQFFTLTSPSRAAVDPEANYAGSIEDGFTKTMSNVVDAEQLWSARLPEYVLESLEPWAAARLDLL